MASHTAFMVPCDTNKCTSPVAVGRPLVTDTQQERLLLGASHPLGRSGFHNARCDKEASLHAPLEMMGHEMTSVRAFL